MERAGGGHLAQELARRQQVLLTDDLLELSWAHPIRQGLAGRAHVLEKTRFVVRLPPCHG
jgi:hypothetical protein